ncbi:hypothetical protein FKP32DRAFT_1678127 [Trametes sanguinea]|nr:hypothetical protein FKP32DRAFT_1678127 [Trametes sanguinea]
MARERTGPIDAKLSLIAQTSIELELSLASVTSVLERIPTLHPQGNTAELQEALALVSERLWATKTAERLARSQLDHLRPYMEVLLLSRPALLQVLDALPLYSSEASIRERLSAPVDRLRGVVADCRDLQDATDECIAEVRATWHREQNELDRAQLVVRLAPISRQFDIQAAVLRYTIIDIEDELRDAELRTPLTIPSPRSDLPVTEFTCALVMYERLKRDITRIHEDQALLAISLDRISRELIFLSMAGTAV